VFFLPIEDSLLGAHYIWRRYSCGSNESSGYYGMACTDKHTRSTYIYGLRRILLMTRQGDFEDNEFDHEITEENE
jgi:hypothetical protein